MRLRLDLEDNASIEGLRDHHIVEDTAVIGRSADCDWQLDCGERLVSRRHAFVSREGDVFVVYDASANGVYVNGAVEPLGEGQRARLSEGDRLRIGAFSVKANILDGSENAEGAEAVEHSPGPAAAVDAPPSSTSNKPEIKPQAGTETPPADNTAVGVGAARTPTLDLGQTRDAFQPPSVTIPEDWDLDVDSDTDQGNDASIPDISGQLDVLEPDIMRGLLEGMKLADDNGEAPQLTRKQAYALGASLRDSLTALILLHREFDRMEKELPATARAPEVTDDVQRRVSEVLRRFVQEGNTEALEELERVQGWTASLTPRPRRFAVALNQAARAAVNVFRPTGFEERAQKQVEAAREQSQWLRWTWGRLLLKLFPEVPYWRAYKGWYAERGDTAQGVVQTLFEKTRKRFILRTQNGNSRTQSGRNPSE